MYEPELCDCGRGEYAGGGGVCALCYRELKEEEREARWWAATQPPVPTLTPRWDPYRTTMQLVRELLAEEN